MNHDARNCSGVPSTVVVHLPKRTRETALSPACPPEDRQSCCHGPGLPRPASRPARITRHTVPTPPLEPSRGRKHAAGVETSVLVLRLAVYRAWHCTCACAPPRPKRSSGKTARAHMDAKAVKKKLEMSENIASFICPMSQYVETSLIVEMVGNWIDFALCGCGRS